jgi:hypothetical protein
MIANSVFEAWWVAPGSPEAAYFWGLVGIALGMGRHAAAAEAPRKTPAGHKGRRGQLAFSRNG